MKTWQEEVKQTVRILDLNFGFTALKWEFEPFLNDVRIINQGCLLPIIGNPEIAKKRLLQLISRYGDKSVTYSEQKDINSLIDFIVNEYTKSYCCPEDCWIKPSEFPKH